LPVFALAEKNFAINDVKALNPDFFSPKILRGLRLADHVLPNYRIVSKHMPRDTRKSEVKMSYGEPQNEENISSNHLIHSEICFLFDKVRKL